MKFNRDAETPFYTFGDTDEPDVSEQLKPIEVYQRALFEKVDQLEQRIDRIEAAQQAELSARIDDVMAEMVESGDVELSVMDGEVHYRLTEQGMERAANLVRELSS